MMSGMSGVFSLLLNWLLAGLGVMIAAYLLPGVVVESFWVAFVTALVLGVINAFLRPIFILLTLPLTLLTLGLFIFIINAGLVMLAGLIVPGFEVVNFWWALLFSMLLMIINAGMHLLSGRVDDDF